MIKRALASLLLAGSLALAAAGPGWLGATVQAVGGEMEEVLGPGAGVVVLAAAPGGPAAKAGLRCLDLVTAINDLPVTDPKDLVAVVGQLPPGGAVTLALVRDGMPMTLQVLLGARPSGAERPLQASEMLAQGPVTALCDLRNPYGFVAAVPAPGAGPWPGLVVRTVTPDSPAAARGLERGMVIRAVGRVATDSQERFEQEVARWSGKPLVLQVAPVPGGPVRVLVVPTSLAAKAGPAFAGSGTWPSKTPGRGGAVGAGGTRLRPVP